MSDSHTLFALRQVGRLYSSGKVLAVLLGVSVILGLAGPFGTSAFMRTGPLLVYWAIITFSTFAAGTFVAAWAANFCRVRGISEWGMIAITSLGTGVVVIFIVIAINWAGLGLPPTDPSYLGTLGISTFATAAIIALMMYYFDLSERPTDGEAEESTTSKTPRLLERLPFDKRGALISMSVSDHYVEVTTIRGNELILMRLSDAILETEGTSGMQVHRSHWVALDQVASARRSDGKVVLTMRDGRDIPVSRSYVPAVKEAGLLPK